MAGDDLTKPLGQNRKAKPPSRLPPLGSLLATLSIALIAALTAYVAIASDPLGGEPLATASIQMDPRRTAGEATAPGSGRQDALKDEPHIRHLPQQAGRDQKQTAQELESQAGVTVLRQNGQAPGSVIIRVPDAQTLVKLAPAPDRRLVERGRHGILPKMGSDGMRPADVYARPVTAQQRNAPVRIAIVVGGLGISTGITSDAIQKLDPAVSLAFAPYGSDLERQVSRARDEGHEVLLQAPMEPFDYPDNDPGPHTLSVALPPEQVSDRLHWVMARFPGYVGLVNFMGGRFMSSSAALAPVMKELSGRGLLFLDDGSSGRSVAGQAAEAAGLSHGKADVVIDAVQRGQEIDAALARLERIAREKGSAIGYGAALPVTVERIARWAKAAEARGVTLVPVSALVSAPKRS